MVVYYSLDGTTKVYAEVLAELIKEQAFELRERKPRVGAAGKARGVIEVFFGLSSELNDLPDLPAGKPVFICSPIWAGTFPPAVSTFIKQSDLKKRKVNVILTCGNILNRDSYKIKTTRMMRLQGFTPGFVQVFACDPKRGIDRATIRKHLKKLVLNVDEAY